MGQTINAAGVAAVQLLLLMYVDPLIYSFIPGSSYVVGLSLIMGFYVFGPVGILVGPLLTGITVTVIDIYSEYKEIVITHPSSGPGGGGGGGNTGVSGTPVHPLTSPRASTGSLPTLQTPELQRTVSAR